MRGLKISERFKSIQVHALSSSSETNGGSKTKHHNLNRHKTILSWSKSKFNNNNKTSEFPNLVSLQLPSTDTIEPSIEPYLKPINLVETLAELYQRIEFCTSQSEKVSLYVELFSVFYGLGDQKLLRRCLRTARQNAEDVMSKVVLSAWLRFERRDDELVGVSSMDCGGYNVLECPKKNLENGFSPFSINDHCKCNEERKNHETCNNNDESLCLFDEESDVLFCVGNEEIKCVRWRIASLSEPFNAMLCGEFVESKMWKIDFSGNGLCSEGMKALEFYSRTKRLDLFSPNTVLELLSFANKFCCEEMKTSCDSHLASIVESVEDALILIEYGLEENATLLVVSCLQIFLRELPNSLHNSKVINFLCSFESKEKLANLGCATFLLYYFLSQVSMEQSMVSKTTTMLLERMKECAAERWQKGLALHQLGCVFLERREYKEAQYCFDEAVEFGHVYSIAGVARTKHKQGQPYSAYKLISSLIFEYKPVGWMYQERALYNMGREKGYDLDFATQLDPSLSFPYKYRALEKVEEKQIKEGIMELDKFLGFKLSPDCLELRAWLYIALEDYDSAMRDIRALLTIEANYITLHGRIKGEYLVQILKSRIQKNQADCWMQLYQQWSSVDDVGSLAIIHQMLENEPGKSLLEFRLSLLLLR
jgi:tetratricopeptide (TPR) repeat protein